MARHRHHTVQGFTLRLDTTSKRVGTSTWPPAGTTSWPPAGTFSWPRTVLEWANQRRDGVQVAELAQETGWPESTISRLTRGLGPYPRPRRGDAGSGHIDPARSGTGSRTARRASPSRPSHGKARPPLTRSAGLRSPTGRSPHRNGTRRPLDVPSSERPARNLTCGVTTPTQARRTAGAGRRHSCPRSDQRSHV
jgi:hypothetical protein